MSSLFSLAPLASKPGVVILAGFKLKEVICCGDEKSIANSDWRHQQNRDDSRQAAVHVDREHLLTSTLQALHHHDTHPLEKFVAQRMILFAIFAQNRAVEKNRCGRRDRARGELPDVWRKHP